ncbi:MAG TPA: YezD family protein [Clostridia bacterium]
MAQQSNIDKGKEGIEKLIELINTVNYGSITVTIQEGKIVQIEKSEKLRLK